MREIYNEGRVVGLSAYELYVRQFLSMTPEATPLTEREWLASTLTDTSSMILKVPAGTIGGYHDFMLPANSQLCCCTIIYASLFQGKVSMSEDDQWATGVISYGPLVSNTPDLHPETPGLPENVPAIDEIESFDQTEVQNRAASYLKITSGLMIQPGEWTPCPPPNDGGEDYQAYKLAPDFTQRGFIRLLISSKLAYDTYILLHGFSDKLRVNGAVNQQIFTVTPRPQDGDFLGPYTFPWSCPIIFTITTDVQTLIDKQVNYKLKVLDLHVNYLGTLHTVTYDLPQVDEHGQVVIIEKTGTVTQMWQDYMTTDLPYWLPLLTQDEEELTDENGDTLLGCKWGSFEQMIIEGGEY